MLQSLWQDFLSRLMSGNARPFGGPMPPVPPPPRWVGPPLRHPPGSVMPTPNSFTPGPYSFAEEGGTPMPMDSAVAKLLSGILTQGGPPGGSEINPVGTRDGMGTFSWPPANPSNRWIGPAQRRYP